VKAFLLSGGLGERLRPLTLSMPKCLVPIGGEPLLGIWLDACARQGITDVLVNVSQHPDQVRRFIDARRTPLPRVTLVVEPAPRGTAGTVLANRQFVAGEESFWILYSDTLTDADLSELAAAHRRHTALLTIGLFRAPVPGAAGIVEMDESGTIVGFEEKPAHPKSDLASAGICLARQGLLDCIPGEPALVDFGRDVFPAVVGRIHGHVLHGFVLDIGTPEALAVASEIWARRASTGCAP
jgi:mannose-1-phosphate guanylyltransferase